MKKTLLYVGMATLAFLNFSCNNDDEVIPEMELMLDRTFMYHDTHETKAATYETKDLQTAFVIENDQLTLFLDSGTDGVSFEIEEDKLTSGYVGEYSLKSLPNPDNGDANTTYFYKNSAPSGSAYFGQANFINGSVEITNYNEKHKLISGTFELTMQDVPDPTITYPTPNSRRCDVTVTGTFENAKLTTNP